MRALIVGGGVVGQVYGFHLAQAGADVSFLVKPPHAEQARRGFVLYPLNRRKAEQSDPVRWAGFRVLTDMAAVARERWDQVYLTVSSTALRSGDWFAALAKAAGSATVIMLQPGPEDRGFVLRQLPEEQLAQGTITVIGYLAPLPGETRFAERGVAYWFPPLTPSPMAGPAARLQPVLEALRRGGLPAKQDPDVDVNAMWSAAAYMPLLVVLAESGWSLRELRRPERLRKARDAGREAVAAMARHHGRRRPLPLHLGLQTPVLLALVSLAPRLVPFDLESYLRVHFTKVGDQTRDFLRYFRAVARAQGVPDRGLTSLHAT
jgi:ketopantoate reductase